MDPQKLHESVVCDELLQLASVLVEVVELEGPVENPLELGRELLCADSVGFVADENLIELLHFLQLFGSGQEVGLQCGLVSLHHFFPSTQFQRLPKHFHEEKVFFGQRNQNALEHLTLELSEDAVVVGGHSVVVFSEIAFEKRFARLPAPLQRRGVEFGAFLQVV